MVYFLPKIRGDFWKETRKGSGRDLKPSLSQGNEEVSESEIEMVKDVSEYDINPTKEESEVFLPKRSNWRAFRQRINDTCEALREGEPLQLTQFTSQLTPRDRQKQADDARSYTRRPILTVGLNIREADKKTLPLVSRSLILSYVEDHYISLQARIAKDPATGKLILHYRPLAGVATFSGLPLSQEWVESVASTVRDIRGLGIYEGKDSDDDSQTAVILFRSAWLEEESSQPTYRHELGIVHAVPSKSDPNSLDLEMFTTSKNRLHWHYFKPEKTKKTRSLSQCDLIASVRFDEYTSDGLQPKSSVTRALKVNGDETYHVAAIDQYLKEQGLNGGWSSHLKQALKGMREGKVPPLK